jgi:tol-pal system protein YbgF
MKFLTVSLAICVVLAFTPALAQDTPPASSTYNETRLSALEDQMRALNGRLEQVEFAVRRLDQTLQKIQSDDDARLTRLESAQAAVPPPQPVQQPVVVQPQTQQQNVPVTQPVDTTGTLGALKVQGNRVTGGVNNPQAPPLPVAPPDYGLTPQEQYERAFALLRQANYPDAEVAFKNFIDKNPKDKLIDNAKYWYGETLYVRERFDESAVAFADAYQQNPAGTKAPDSLLKLGMSLAALNKIPDACVTLNELKTKYPNAAPTVKSRADDERSRLKCPAH